MRRPIQGRWGFGGYPWHGPWVHRTLWRVLGLLIRVLAPIIGFERAGRLDMWRVEGE